MEEKNNSFFKGLIEFVKFIGPPLLFAFIITRFLIANSVIPTGSMDTTIPPHSRIIGNRLAYLFGKDPERGDIIIFKYPDNESVYYVKRIIGISGDTVEIVPNNDGSNNGYVLVNGEKITEPYLKEPMQTTKYQKFEVPNNSYFCMGDNRNNSYDARFWQNTYVNRNKIIAKYIFTYFKGQSS